MLQINMLIMPQNTAYSAKSAHPFQRNGAPFRLKLSKAQLGQQVTCFLYAYPCQEIPAGRLSKSFD